MLDVKVSLLKLTITVFCIENLPIFVECGKTCVHAGAVRVETKQINGYYVGIHGSISLTGIHVRKVIVASCHGTPTAKQSCGYSGMA